VESDEGERPRSGAMERKDGGRPRAVERAVVVHVVAVRAWRRSRDATRRGGAGGAAGWVRALRGIKRKGKVRAEYYFSLATWCESVGPFGW